MKRRSVTGVAILAIGAAITGGSATARADLVDTTLPVVFEAPSGWNFYPGTKDSHVIGFLAVQMQGAVPVNGFNVVWYERLSDGAYKMCGWTGADPKSAGRTLSSQYGAPRLFAQSDLQISDCGEMTESAVFSDMANGLTLTDPLQPLASSLPPIVMEGVVQAGAQGAAQLSADAVDIVSVGSCQGDKTQVALQSYLVTTEEWMFGQVNTTPDPGCAASVCVPGTITLSSISVTVWSPFVVTCANGSCQYSGTTTTTTKTCYQHWDCHLTDCVTTITTSAAARNCPPGAGGACVGPPPPC